MIKPQRVAVPLLFEYEVNYMADIMELAKDWRNLPTSFEGREVLRDGDEVWVGDTLELGLPIVWLKRSIATIPEDFDYVVIHNKGYDEPTGEHWCWDCHTLLCNKGGKWVCPRCGDEFSDDEVDTRTSPTEEASYPDDSIEPNDEWYDNYYRDNPHIPHDEYDFEGF